MLGAALGRIAARRSDAPAGIRRAGRIFAGLTIGGIALLGLVVAILAIGPGLIAHPVPRPADVARSTEVLDRDGKLLRAYAAADDRWRLAVPRDGVDPQFFDMLLAYEDRRFFSHPGVDWRALARAAWQAAKAGKIVSGGSTLTMQVARLLDCGGARSVLGKAKQILCALKLERTLTKEEILELYLLKAPYGGNIEGVRAAALAYFGKEPARLTPAQAALLVALPQSPESRRPDRAPEAGLRARDRVLARAVGAGILDTNEAAAAARERMPDHRRAFPMLAAHAADRARMQHPETAVLRLTLDHDLQSRMEALAAMRARRLGPRRSAAILVVDHASGEILASVGSPNYLSQRRQGAIDMTRAVRSPGSTLKPLIYGLAFEEGLAAPQSLIEDRPANIAGYAPENFDDEFRGTVTIREALELSLNIPAVSMLDAVGPARLMARMQAAGMRPTLPRGETPGLAIGLGGLGTTLHDLAALYSAIARGGLSVRLRESRSAATLNSGPGKHVLSQLAAWYVADILAGTPAPARRTRERIAFKTGTSYGYRDAWAVGFDGAHVVAVWSGRPDGAAIPAATGQLTAAPILFDAFARLGRPHVPLPAPPAGAMMQPSAELPTPLRTARVRSEQAAHVPGVRIAFPPDGARLDLEDLRAGAANGVVLKLSRGTPPFLWFADGAPIGSSAYRRRFTWMPAGIGFTTLTVLDSSGSADRIRVRVR